MSVRHLFAWTHAPRRTSASYADGRRASKHADRKRHHALAAAVSAALDSSTSTTAAAAASATTATAPAAASTPLVLSVATHQFCTTADRLVRASRKLVADYETMAAHVGEAATAVHRAADDDAVRAWSANVRRTRSLLEHGYRTMLRRGARLLGVGADEGVPAEEPGERGPVKDAEADIAAERDGDVLTTLRYAERGVKRMAKGLPQDGSS